MTIKAGATSKIQNGLLLFNPTLAKLSASFLVSDPYVHIKVPKKSVSNLEQVYKFGKPYTLQIRILPSIITKND